MGIRTRKWGHRVFSLVLAGLLVFLPLFFHMASALAYTTTGSYWSGSWPVVNYYINSASFPSSVGTETEVITAIRKGVNHWNFESGARITFVYKGASSLSTRSNDGTNVVYYDADECDLPGGNCIGATEWWPSGSISGFDVTFNGKDDDGNSVPWDAVDPVLFHTDLWGYAAHEFGHALGLGHSTVSAATMQSTVGVGASWLRYLTSDDMNGAQYLYGANTEITSSATQVAPGISVTVTTDFDDSVSLEYEFKASANGTSPGVSLAGTDPVDTRVLQLNTPHLNLHPAASPSPFVGATGTLNASGQGTLTWNTSNYAGQCIDFVAIIKQATNNWPNNYRHVTGPRHICVNGS